MDFLDPKAKDKRERHWLIVLFNNRRVNAAVVPEPETRYLKPETRTQ